MAEPVFAVKRVNPRFPFSADAEAFLKDGSSVLGEVFELSSGGCYVGTLSPVSAGSEMRLRIDNEQTETACEVPAKVIYLHPSHGIGICGIGVVFGEMDLEQRATLESWLLALKEQPAKNDQQQRQNQDQPQQRNQKSKEESLKR
jgi:Tfp pilus assembly protein PilZ